MKSSLPPVPSVSLFHHSSSLSLVTLHPWLRLHPCSSLARPTWEYFGHVAAIVFSQMPELPSAPALNAPLWVIFCHLILSRMLNSSAPPIFLLCLHLLALSNFLPLQEEHAPDPLSHVLCYVALLFLSAIYLSIRPSRELGQGTSVSVQGIEPPTSSLESPLA